MAGRYGQRNTAYGRSESSAMMLGLGMPSQPGVGAPLSAAQRQQVQVTHKATKRPASVDRLLQKVTKQSNFGLQGLARMMAAMDDNGDRKLTESELKYGLEDYNVRVNAAELSELFQYFDKDNSGTITYDEFIRELRGPMSDSRQALVQKAFRTMDLTIDGKVTLEELEMAYNPEGLPEVRSGKETKGEALREFVRQWQSATEDDGEISEEEFVEFYKNVSCAVTSDAEFERMICETWRLPFEPEGASTTPSADSSGLRVHVTHTDGRRTVETLPGMQSFGRPHSTETLRAKLLDQGIVAVGPIRVLEKENVRAAPIAAEIDPKRAAQLQFRRSSANNHPDAPRPGKQRLPDWLKYDKVVLKFEMYSKEVVHSHAPKFDKHTREFDTSLSSSYTLRRFVASFYVADKAVSIDEPAVENSGGYGGKPFLKKGKLQNPVTGKDFVPTDFAVGAKVNIAGRDFVIIDADKATRDFFKAEYPKVRLSPAIALPFDPNPPKPKEVLGKGTRQRKHGGGDISGVGSLPRDSDTFTSSKFLDNDGKILVYDAIWDDHSLYGDRRTFTLRYFLGDDMIELREVVPTGTGRSRYARLNLSKQRLPNPKALKAGECYRPSDLILGGTVEAFGRELVLTGCDEFTREYFKSVAGRPQPEGKELEGALDSALGGDGPRAPLSMPVGTGMRDHKPAKLDLYSASDQKRVQLLNAIRQQLEQRSNFGAEREQRRLLWNHLAKYGAKNGAISKKSFRDAMSVFSCFGSDADRLYDDYDANKDGSLSFEEFANVVYPRSTVSSTNAWGPLDGADTRPAAAPSKPGRAAVSVPPLDATSAARVAGLEDSIRRKRVVETMTNFGEPRHQELAMKRIFKRFDRDRSGTLTKDEFCGALSELNCWDGADCLFAAYDVDGNGHLDYAEFSKMLSVKKTGRR